MDEGNIEVPVLRGLVWMGNSKMRDSTRTKTEFEKGSGNVFADLELKDSEELYARAVEQETGAF